MGRVFPIVLLGVGLVFPATGRADLQALPQSPVNLSMEDQFQQVRKSAGYQGHVLVLIYGDKASADANKSLGSLLHLTFHPTAAQLPEEKALTAPVIPCPGTTAAAPGPDVFTVPIACIGKVPALVRTIIRNQFKRNSPAVPVWLDFEDLMRTAFAFQPGVPNLLIIDTRGQARYSASGKVTPELATQISRAIQSLREEALPKK